MVASSLPDGVGCVPMKSSAIKALLEGAAQVQVVNHWATWCDPCVEELPLLAELAGRLPGRAGEVGVSWDLFEGGRPDRVVERVTAFSRAHGLSYPSALVSDAPEEFFDALKIGFRQIPQTWVVRPGGEVVYRVEGILTEETVEKIMEVVAGM